MYERRVFINQDLALVSGSDSEDVCTVSLMTSRGIVELAWVYSGDDEDDVKRELGNLKKLSKELKAIHAGIKEKLRELQS